jgi:acetyl esterase
MHSLMKKQPLKIAAILLAFFLPAMLIAQNRPYSTDGYDSYMAEIRKWNLLLAAVYPKLDLSTPQGLAKARTVWGPPGGKTVLKPHDRFLHVKGGNIRIRIFRPDTIRAVVLDIHGGGFVAGRPESGDSLNDIMARYCKVAVVSVDYRLAPENPFISEVEDCDSVAQWLLQNAPKEFGTDKLVFSGFSAGATLAALTLIDIRDKMQGIGHVIGANFFYGGFSHLATPSQRMANAHSLILDSAILGQIGRIVFHGLNDDELMKYSPLYARLQGLPPALFSVGTKDPLIDDNTFMANRWETAGNQVTLYVYPECPHAFNFFPTQIAKLANQRVNDWLNGLLE